MNHHSGRARKRFGQHFLHDQGVIDRIIAAFDPQPGQCIVEIGPGHGALTAPLLQAVRRLEVIELDRDLISELPRQFAGQGELRVHSGDALRFDFSRLAGDSRLRVIGNLPYNISSPFIFHLLDQAAAIDDMLFMLQREVVDRLTAVPGSKNYGRLSVMVQFACEVTSLFRVRPGAFRPPPAVESAMVHLRPYHQPIYPIEDPAALATVVRLAFAQRRKTLRNTLRDVISPEKMAVLGIDPGDRAERLTLADFATLANELSKNPPPSSCG